MGHLYFFNLPHLIERYKLRAFIETGTGYGFGVYLASQYPQFEGIVSCDVVSAEIERLKPAFQHDKRIHLYDQQSPAMLRQLLPRIPLDMPILFWLDAHYPGAHFTQKSLDAEQDLNLRLPLRAELETIKELRQGCKDVILIDDLRIYEDDQFESGNLANGYKHLMQLDSGWLYTLFEATHEAHRSLKGEGYLALFPKDA